MKYKILFSILLLVFLSGAEAQPPSEKRNIRIVDTLSAQERNTRNPVILRAELDSLIQVYNASLPQTIPQQPVKEVVTETPLWVSISGIIALVIIGLLLYRLSSYQKRLNRVVGDLKRLVQNFDFLAAGASTNGSPKSGKSRSINEKRISELSEELEKQKGSNKVLADEYTSIKQAIKEAYKVKNYPFYDKDKQEGQMIRDLVNTERSVALDAFEKFLKPIIAITDANKNNPARISKEESQELVELLISLSLYHIEYLYLRVNELAVGGNIVQRIGSNGKGIDPVLLKKLDMEHGSRALALRMALDKVGVSKLSYPVFDETDLNNY
jgi:hypothetical protein